MRVQSYWNLCFSCLSPTSSSWRLGLTSGTQIWVPKQPLFTQWCLQREVLPSAGSRGRSGQQVCLRTAPLCPEGPHKCRKPPEGDYLEGDLACSALCGSRPHFSCGVGLEYSSRDQKTTCTARLPSPISEPRERSLWLGLLFFIPTGISSTVIQY